MSIEIIASMSHRVAIVPYIVGAKEVFTVSVYTCIRRFFKCVAENIIKRKLKI